MNVMKSYKDTPENPSRPPEEETNGNPTRTMENALVMAIREMVILNRRLDVLNEELARKLDEIKTR
jgi:hypothetical protein